MATYLITWNPNKWPWKDLQDCTEEIKYNGYYLTNWSCGRTKKILKKDRIFMIRLGSEPRGIFASGWANSDVYDGCDLYLIQLGSNWETVLIEFIPELIPAR